MASSVLDRFAPKDGSAIALLFVGVITGFFIGRVTSKQTPSPISRAGPIELIESDESGSESGLDGDVDVSKMYPREDCKLVLVVRTDLGMTKGMNGPKD